MKKILPLVLGLLLICACNPSPKPVGYISPPGIFNPIYNGTEIIGYKNAKAGYDIKVYANKSELLGQGTVTPWGYGTIKVNRPLQTGDIITAAQIKNNNISFQTWLADAVTVSTIPASKLIKGEKFYPPTIPEPVYECQNGYWVTDLVEGVQLKNEIDNPSYGTANVETPYRNVFIYCSAVNEEQELRSTQKLPSLNTPKESDYSKKVTVKPKPATLQKPVINEKDLVIGATMIGVINLIPGAEVDIYSVNTSTGEKTNIGGGISKGHRMTFHIDTLKSLDIISQQALCELKSPPSKPAKPKNILNPPKIKRPICDGAIKVTIHNTILSADIEIKVKRKNQKNFVPLGSATASSGITIVHIGGGVPLKEGDQIIAHQITTSLSSKWTDPATVEKYSSECACYPPESYTLPVDLIGQETNQWCWAASGQMIMKFLGKNVTQCEQANKAFAGEVTANCCKKPVSSSCIKACYLMFHYYGFKSENTGNYKSLSWDQVKEEIYCKQKPYCSRIIGPHYVVVIGYKTEGGKNYLIINDPSPVSSGSQYSIQYDKHVAKNTSDQYDITYTGT